MALNSVIIVLEEQKRPGKLKYIHLHSCYEPSDATRGRHQIQMAYIENEL